MKRLNKTFKWFVAIIITIIIGGNLLQEASVQELISKVTKQFNISNTLVCQDNSCHLNIPNTTSQEVNNNSSFFPTSKNTLQNTKKGYYIDLSDALSIYEQKGLTFIYEKGTISKGVDGDTIYVLVNIRCKYQGNKKISCDTLNQEEKIRFIGIDTPETKHPRKGVEYFGKEASDFTSSFVGSEVVLLSDPTQALHDKYFRQLRYVFPKVQDGVYIMLNHVLVKAGYAHEYTYNVPYIFQQEFKQAEDYARNNNLGLWQKE